MGHSCFKQVGRVIGEKYQMRIVNALIFFCIVGVLSADFEKDDFLDVYLVGNTPPSPAGQVQIVNVEAITTNNTGAHGITASSSSSGYPSYVINSLMDFREDGFSFEVTEVKDADGQVVDFGAEPAVEIRGFRVAVDEDGAPLADAQGKFIPFTDSEGHIVEHGTFVIGKDGTFSMSFSAAETSEHNALASGESVFFAVRYNVLGENSTGITSEDFGELGVAIRANDEGELETRITSVFSKYGLSFKPSLESNPTLFPDLQEYVDEQLADIAGGAGGAVAINNAGAIETQGAASHGISAQSQGGRGGTGRTGSMWRSATAGGAGKTPGAVSVVSNGTIKTKTDESSGIVAISAGGAGGAGGYGGWAGLRHGAAGGTGGDGGFVMVTGSGSIETEGDYATGIIALSVGGDGGAGGKGSGAMSGGRGGYGGRGGSVFVDGNWDITTVGDKSHGIWAKSLGGNAGDGGSGGWLFGKPGGGGQATDGGNVKLHSGGKIQTDGHNSYGLYAQSVGGFGGDGGASSGLFWSFGGNADSGGSGGTVEVVNFETGKVKTTGDYSHALFAQSIGGGGGSGGGKFGLLASLGGSGASGGSGGSVLVENDGRLKTTGTGAFGIFAQSVGGGGGDGGSVSGLVAIGGDGSQTSDGGDVVVINRGVIITKGEQSHGIFAESIGGGGGNGGRSGGLISIGGDGGSGGDAGAVTIIHEGFVFTGKKDSYGLFAQSVGGGGGSGGGAVSVGAGASVAIGGKGAAGGHGSTVEVDSREGSRIITEGERSYGIFAQSVGGGGGDGGFAITGSAGGISVAVGGGGGAGGNSGTVDVTMDGEITTSGEEAYGIFAQSVGGGGGAGGFAIAGSYGGSGMNVNLGLGGKGGVGGLSDTVTVDINGTIETSGLRAHGILAQSVGGGGGAGGFAIAGSIGGGTNVNLAFGGDGGTGNRGGNVNVNGSGTLTTENDDAHGIFAQSVGGSGGAGGFTVAASLGGGTSLNLALGGAGGDGSSAGNVTVGSETMAFQGTVTTFGDRSYGIQAQSIGGGGGAGGASIAGALLGPGAISMGFGGIGGKGGFGGTTDVYSAAEIATYGLQSHGIFAQSVGGGGGAGGLSIAGGVTAFGGLSLAMGGDGGEGNTGGDVTVHNSGSIDTNKDYSYGIFAQSVGGKGGAGGSSGAVMVNFSSLIPIPPEYPTGSVNISLSLGGDGGKGGRAGRVEVDNTGFITTLGDHSYGILAQSVGGGGGDGGKSIAVTANISMPSAPGGGEEPQLEVQVDFAMALGGDGGEGNEGGEVDVLNRGSIETTGIGAHGIFAQSVGGGGGSGGDARSMILSIDPSNWNPAQSPPDDPTSISIGATLSLGGDGGSAGHGGTVFVENQGVIITRGADAFGILAQSVGGGGGVGGGGYHGLDWEDFGISTEMVPLLDLLPMEHDSDLDISLGGSGGGGGDGGDVTVHHTGAIETYGAGSVGLLAQSIGGGGGLGGVGAISGVLDSIDQLGGILGTTPAFSTALDVIGVVSDGFIGLGGGAGGTAGDGGAIHINLTGGISTTGVAAHGIFAQSVGGGGGYGGNADQGIIAFGINQAIGRGGGSDGDGGDIFIQNEGRITTQGPGAIGIFAQSVGGGGGLAGGVGLGFGFAGSVGGSGQGGRVEILHTGDITTHGAYAHGIFAQSVGGSEFGGDVIVNISGNITVSGEGALAVIAQSEGAAGRKNIDVTYNGGTITGNSSSAVRFSEGLNNTLTNFGVITTHGGADGTAILASSGNDSIYNHGTIFGSVNLGAGVNEFINYAGAIFQSGQLLGLGAGATAVNQGIFAPGGNGLVCTTVINGHLEQAASGLMMIDWDLRSGQSDCLDVSGIADLAGQAQIKLLNVGYLAPGTTTTTLVNAAGGVIDSGLSMTAPRTAVIDYDLMISGQDVQLAATMDAAPAGLLPNQMKMGEYINRIQASGQAQGFAPFAEQLFMLPDVASLADAYNQLSPATFAFFADSTYNVNSQYTNSLVKRMHSLRSNIQRNDDTMQIAQVMPNSVWLDGFGQRVSRKSVPEFSGFTATTVGSVFGYDYLLGEGFLAGLSFGFANTSVNPKGSAGRSDIDSYFGSLYGSWFSDQMYVDVALTYGFNRMENVRAVQIGELSGLAHSTHNAGLWSAYIESGLNVTLERWIAQPFAAFRYSCLREDSVRESGLEGANLLIDKRNTESLQMHLGARFSRPFKREDWVVIPEIMAAWVHDFSVESRLVAAFDSAPGLKFTTDARNVERNGLCAGVGLTMINKDRVSISINYQGEYRNNYTAHGLIGGIRVEF